MGQSEWKLDRFPIAPTQIISRVREVRNRASGKAMISEQHLTIVPALPCLQDQGEEPEEPSDGDADGADGASDEDAEGMDGAASNDEGPTETKPSVTIAPGAIIQYQVWMPASSPDADCVETTDMWGAQKKEKK